MASVTHILKNKKENLGNDTPVILTSVSGKVTEQILLSALSWCRKDEKLTGKKRYVSAMGRFCSITVTVSCGEVTSSKQELLSPGTRGMIVGSYLP